MPGLLDALVGSSDPSTADPNTGLVDSQRRQLAFNALGQTGALLLAAGAPHMPGQDAPYLAALGNVAGNTQQQGLQMAQQNALNQRNIALQRENQQKAEVLKYTQTPEFQQAFNGLPPAGKAVAQAQLRGGDTAGLLKTIQESRAETTPKFNPDGSFYLPSTGEYVDPVRGIRMKVDSIGQPGNGVGSVASATGGAFGNTATGEDFLKGMAPGYANSIRAYAQGRAQISPMLARTAAGQKILSDISQYDPTFDQTNYGQRFQAAKDFAPQGKTGQAIIQNNTVIEHSAQLLDRARALNNTSIPLLNSGLNVVSEQRGDSPVTRFNQQKLRLVDEMAKLLKGGQGSEGEINRQLSVLHAAQSPEQLQSGIEDMIQAAESRKSSQLAQYQTAMGRSPTPDLTHAYHNPEAEAASATIKANPLPGSDRYKQMQDDAALRLQAGGAPAQGSTDTNTPQLAIPDGAVALLKANPALRDAFDQKYGAGASARFLGQSGQPAQPPVQGARQAPDGNWYVPDPTRGPNKYLRVDNGAGTSARVPGNDMPPLGTLKEGHVTTYGNGQKWTIQNGQPMQLDPQQPQGAPDPLAQLRTRAAQGDKKAAAYLKSIGQ